MKHKKIVSVISLICSLFIATGCSQPSNSSSSSDVDSSSVSSESIISSTESVEDTIVSSSESVDNSVISSTESVEDSVISSTESVEDSVISSTESVEDSVISSTESVEDSVISATESVEDSVISSTESVEDSAISSTESVEDSSTSDGHIDPPSNPTMSPNQWILAYDANTLRNVTMTGNLLDFNENTNTSVNADMIIKLDNGKSSEYGVYENGYWYQNIYELTSGDSATQLFTRYEITRTRPNTWHVYENYTFGYTPQVLLALMPLYDKYQEFTFNPATSYYEASDLTCTSIAFGTLEYDTVSLRFSNGYLIRIEAKMKQPFNTAALGADILEYNFTFSDYGTTVVTIPDVSSDASSSVQSAI